jgi:hypothetical protein
MNRREAIAALVSLPAVTRISAAQLTPTDVIVVECEDYLTQAGKAGIRAQLEKVWPGRTILVCDGQIRIKVIAGP